MKSLIRIVFTLLVLIGILSACAKPAATPSTDDVVNTAVAGTQQAQVLAQATINASVLTAIPATPSAGPTIEYTALTEEELATLINQSVTQAIAATEQTTAAVTTTTSDNAVTSQEVTYVYDYYYNADYYIEQTEQLLNEYYSLYSDLAQQMIVELNGVQTELPQMNDTLSSIDSSLQQINSTLQQGLTVAEDTINQLEATAQTAQTSAQELQA